MTGFYFVLQPRNDRHSIRQFLPAVRFVAQITQVFGPDFRFGDQNSALSRIWPDLETQHTYLNGDEVLLVTAHTEAGELWLQMNQPPDTALMPKGQTHDAAFHPRPASDPSSDSL